MTLYRITLHPSPLTGGDPSTVLARLLAHTDAVEPPAFALTLSAAMSLGLLTDAQGGITSTRASAGGTSRLDCGRVRISI